MERGSVNKRERSTNSHSLHPPVTCFKFRCEVANDVITLLNDPEFSWSKITLQRVFLPISVNWATVGIPDVDVELETWDTYDNICKRMRNVPNGNVMYGTINYADKYTGEDRYNSDNDNDNDNDADNNV